MIELTKDMVTGVDLIDTQHAELITRINAVLSNGADAIEETKKTIDFLEEYVIKHFSEEEALQKQHNYPKIDWHKEQHQLYIGEVKNLKKEFAENGNSILFTNKLNSAVIKWIVQHIKTVDVELGKFINGQIKL